MRSSPQRGRTHHRFWWPAPFFGDFFPKNPSKLRGCCVCVCVCVCVSSGGGGVSGGGGGGGSIPPRRREREREGTDGGTAQRQLRLSSAANVAPAFSIPFSSVDSEFRRSRFSQRLDQSANR
jgi:hypothetical protein